ncbi:MAG: 3'-5' exonuclease, partial [Actinomycetota bacterium]
FKEMIDSLAEISGRSPVAETLSEMLAETGYLEALQAERTIEAQGRIENLEELVGVTAEYDRHSPDGTLGDFLQEISLYTDIDALEGEADAVTIMTLHNAKGLEFPVVFIVGAEEGVFPHFRSLEEQNLEEERRLCYVGMTRAMQNLYFTHAATRNLYGARNYNMASRFLAELPDEAVEFGSYRDARRKRSFAGDAEAAVKSFFHVGDSVLHASFGEGVVTGVELGGAVAVRFAGDGSERKLMVEYAPLKKLEK